jgi:hypothetical protein
MGRKSLKAKAAELMKNSRGLIGAHGHFTRRAAAATTDASDERSSLHREEKEQDHNTRSNDAIQPEADEEPAGLVVNGAGDGGGGGGDGPPDIIEGEDGSDGDEDDGDGGDAEAEDTWPPHTIEWFNQIKQDINDSLRFTGRGKNAKFLGKMPRLYVNWLEDSPLLRV